MKVNKYKHGTKVKMVRDGSIYPTFVTMMRYLGMPERGSNVVEKEHPDYKEHTYTVMNSAPYANTFLYYIKSDKGAEFIIAEEGLGGFGFLDFRRRLFKKK